jgi:hypothetical protein
MHVAPAACGFSGKTALPNHRCFTLTACRAFSGLTNGCAACLPFQLTDAGRASL